MSYYVSLGDIELDQVLTVAQSGERDISTYDSVGGGKFAVAQNKGLREWTIKCEINDHDLIDDLDDLQKRKSPFRLVISGGDYKISKRVFLKSYSREEEYAGVFPTTLKLTEYVKAGVKTTSVPYVAREGTRVLPAVVTVGDGTGTTQTPYDIKRLCETDPNFVPFDTYDSYTGEQLRDPDTGNSFDNIADIPNNTETNLYTYQNLLDPKNELSKPAFTLTGIDESVNAWCDKTNKAIASAWDKFTADFVSRLKADNYYDNYGS